MSDGPIHNKEEKTVVRNGDEKYKQACEDYRFYGDMRFKQLTLFSAVTVFLLNVATSEKAVPLLSSHSNKALFGIAGMFFTAVFWLMELRSTMYALESRAEKERIEQRSPREWELMTASNVVLFLFAVSYGFWFSVWKDAGAVTSCRSSPAILFIGSALWMFIYSIWRLCQIWRRLSAD
jgi:hypothetical protein